jgi:prepilin-type N-terminal cleavage/methylation domain-containing protein
MKTRSACRGSAKGFTLVELLVVISIIVVLAAMGVNVAASAITRAKKLRSTNDATQLLHGIENFDRDYGRFPDFGATGEEAQTDGEAGAELLTILLGKEEVSDSMQNKKQTAFVEFKESQSRNHGGLVYSSGAADARPEGLYDAWGNPFHIKIDTENDGALEDPFTRGKVIRASVIVYSYGADKKAGGNDDVKTW